MIWQIHTGNYSVISNINGHLQPIAAFTQLQFLHLQSPELNSTFLLETLHDPS
jgi:hypothetical protein